MLLSCTCCVALLTAIPGIATGSFFGSFVLYSSLQRCLELLVIYASLRYVHVQRSYSRRAFMREAQRIEFITLPESSRHKTHTVDSTSTLHLRAAFPSVDTYGASEQNRQNLREFRTSIDEIPPPSPVSSLPRNDSYSSRNSSCNNSPRLTTEKVRV